MIAKGTWPPSLDGTTVADPISDAFAAFSSNFLCLLGALGFLALVLLLFVLLRIRRVRRDSSWAYNPEKTLKLRWRRG